jgi:hypothetical protein
MKRVLAVGAVAVLVAGGAMGIFFYASATPIFYASSPSSAPSTRIVTSRTSTKGAGWIDPNGQPQGAWAAYLGFIPAGYSLAPHDAMAPTFPCPAGMSSDQCGLFQASCGNGVCDPNEGCMTCPSTALLGHSSPATRTQDEPGQVFTSAKASVSVLGDRSQLSCPLSRWRLCSLPSAISSDGSN